MFLSFTAAVDRPSALRSKLHESISDPKYSGVRVSRSQLEGDEDADDSESASEDGADDPAKDFADGDEQPVTSDDETDNSEDKDTHPDSDPDEEVSPPVAETGDSGKTSGGVNVNVDEKDELSSTLKRAREEERKKGKAVARQLVSL